MKRNFLFLAFLGAVFFLGCGLNKEFVRAVDDHARFILPRYEEYVSQDPDLKKDTKRIRIQEAKKFQELINAAKEKENIRE